MSQKSIALRLLVAVTVLFAAACGDGDPTGVTEEEEEQEPFTAQDKQALTAALESGGALGPAAGLTGFFVPQVSHVGTFTLNGEEYHALAFQIDSDLPGPASELTGFVAWNDLDADMQSFDELISILVQRLMEEGETAELGQMPLGGAQAFVQQPGDQFPILYISSEGSFTISALELGESQECEMHSSTGSGDMSDIECTFREGTMDGSFDFDATIIPPDGETISRAASFEDIPTVALTVTGLSEFGFGFDFSTR